MNKKVIFCIITKNNILYVGNIYYLYKIGKIDNNIIIDDVLTSSTFLYIFDYNEISKKHYYDLFTRNINDDKYWGYIEIDDSFNIEIFESNERINIKSILNRNSNIVIKEYEIIDGKIIKI